jgi:hypothetical protein
MPSFIRYAGLQAKLGDVSKDFIDQNIVLTDASDPFVPNTDQKVQRLQKHYLGPSTVVFYVEDADALVLALLAYFKTLPLRLKKPGGAVPIEFHSTRHRKSKRASKGAKKTARLTPSGHAAEEAGR